MKQDFELYADDIPGFNEIIAAAKTLGRRKKGFVANSYTSLKKKWLGIITKELKEHNIQPLETVFLELTWIEPHKKRDPDNIAAFIKFILDALQKEQIIKNDGWNQVTGWTNTFKTGPKRGVKVRISDETIR
jgi:Holliday junction resolvase RusA-like endonuclease